MVTGIADGNDIYREKTLKRLTVVRKFTAEQSRGCD